MPSIDDFDIPASLVRELTQIVDQTSVASLQVLAKQRPELGRGLRPQAAGAKFLRQRLRTKLTEAGRLSDELRDFLAFEGLNGQLLMVLSQTAVAECLSELLAVYGRESLLAALLVDRRPGVRQLAIDYCRAVDWQTRPLPERDQAIAALGERLQPFWQATACFARAAVDGGGEAAMADGSLTIDCQQQEARLAGCRQKVVELEERLHEAKEGAKACRKVDLRLETERRRLAELSTKLERERHLRLTLESDLRQARTDLAALGAEAEERLRAAIAQEMRSVLRPWLAGAERLRQEGEALVAQAADDILPRLERVLAHQAERDRACGTHRLLRARLAELSQAEERLLQAANDSLCPLPELGPLLAELRDEAERLERLLGQGGRGGPLVERLSALIRQAVTETDLGRIKQLIQALEACNGLTPAEGRALYHVYHDCLGRLFDRFAPQPLAVGRDSDPALAVTRARAGEEGDFVWLLDGYNILFGLPDLFAELYEDGRPAARARERLLDLVDRYLTAGRGLADVFFDGELSHQENFSPRVRVIYSGGGTAGVRNRADAAIIEALEHQAVLQGTSRIVVTNDRELGERALAAGARLMPLGQFVDLLLS